MGPQADLAERLLQGDRGALARAVTLVESVREEDKVAADALLAAILPKTGRAHRVAISGAPGAGKSTLIDALGARLLERGKRVAVFAIDPSSAISGGSILADKTRMTRVAADPRAFVRPSPSANTLGGVARRTRDAMLLAEAAGYDFVLVETVGVGQSETEARQMVDTFVLLLLPGSGDELQGIKRGIVEMAHVVAVNKADGDNLERARAQAREYESALPFVGRGPGAKNDVLVVSALTGDGVDALLDRIAEHRESLATSGGLERARSEQARHALRARAEEELLDAFRRDPNVAERLKAVGADVEAARVTPGAAARALIDVFRRRDGGP